MNGGSDLRGDIADLYAAYAACLDAGTYEAWPDFFTNDCRYRLIPRENHERGLPLATMDLQGRAALADRVFAVSGTIFHAPYYQRHIIGPARILGPEGGELAVEANYVVIRTKRDLPSEVFNAGRYLDRIVRTEAGVLFAEKTCVFDSELVPNSIIYPI